ncbi:DUF4253 domain-containing protein [Saccharibacillus sp. VR-M41]|uniref:DUF4253 domain-containing protein n=2 Tax=Saccharibacillus alkalitolerans TaxID=2705290 RepID=A0ABX0F4A4_9BACL|nr:DUF4253 domain-containing protein [Saccharibacillus alkalitolerans]
MLEEAADGEDSIRLYAERQRAAAEAASAADVLRSLVDSALTDSGLPTSADGGIRDVYGAYAALWDEQGELLDERIVPAAGEDGRPDEPGELPDSAWVGRHGEDGLLLLDLPEAEAWTAPLIVPMGGYNECPQPIEQAVLFRDWQKRFGAVPTAVAEDTWLLQVSRLPETDEEALNLAREHFIFCSYVLEAFDSIGRYAAHLKSSRVWSFWWD